MWRDKGLRFILLIVPFLSLLLFYGVYHAQVIQAIPTAIVDLDRSSTSRELITQLKQAEYLQVNAYLESYAELEAQIQQGQVVVGIVIPEEFGTKVALSQPTRIFMAIDGSNIIYATNATSALLSVTRTLSAEIGVKTLMAQGVQIDEAKESYQAIAFREEPWFNPTLNYANFLVLALGLNMWQQCCVLAATITIIGEAGWKSWLQWKALGIGKLPLFISKAFAHIITYMALVLPIFALVFLYWRFPLAANCWLLLAFTFIFAVTLHGIGTMMSSLARNAVDAARFGMLIALPSFVLSGYTWPIEVMPWFLQKVVWVLPQTWFFQGLNYLIFKNPSWEFISTYFLALVILAVIAYTIAAVATSRL